MFRRCEIKRCGVHLLSAWCLLCTLVGGEASPAPLRDARACVCESAIAPKVVDFSDTAVQQNCHALLHASQQLKCYAWSVGLLAPAKPSTASERYSMGGDLGQNHDSLLELGVALLL
jgi:hypothetical protein